MTKREGRIFVFELLFENDFNKDTAPEVIYNRAIMAREAKASKFTDDLYAVCIENSAEIDRAVENVSQGWKLSRMSCVTRAILRMTSGELLYTDVPPKVAINEALEISKIYNDQKSTSFINGILNRLARDAGKLGDGE